MRRRSLLKALAATAALSPMGVLRGQASPAMRALRRVRPSDPGWPSATSWQKLNEALGGNLIRVHGLFDACAKDRESSDCRDTLANIRNPFFLGDQPGGTQVSGWLDAWTPAASVYAVKARNAADVAAAITFARDNNLRLVVKGTGHSYLGTSNAPDSLLVWTRAMNNVLLHDAFVPQGCDGTMTPLPAVTAESGAMWIDLYTAVTTKAGRYVQGGGCTDVGVAGLVQSGGFGSYSKAFGTAASGLLEAEVVTADGHIRIANACTNPDLFWALKGGGGGSWGVVTKVTLRTHDLPSHFGAAWGTIKAKSDEAFRKLIARFFAFYTDSLFNPHWGEQVSINSDNSLEISMVCQGLDTAQIRAVWQPFQDWVRAQPDLAVTEALNARAIPSAQHMWDVAGNPEMVPDRRPGVPNYHGWWKGDQAQVGAFLHGYESLWLPAVLLQKNRQAQLASALFAASRYKPVHLHINKGLAGAPDDVIAMARETATNPAVTEAFALVIIADGEGPTYAGLPVAKMDETVARKDARMIDLAAAELFKVAPNAGSYVSESNYFNSRWQDAYWGENYARLRSIKNRYDPEGLFFVHHGVGSEDWSADGFTRVSG